MEHRASRPRARNVPSGSPTLGWAAMAPARHAPLSVPRATTGIREKRLGEPQHPWARQAHFRPCLPLAMWPWASRFLLKPHFPPLYTGQGHNSPESSVGLGRMDEHHYSQQRPSLGTTGALPAQLSLKSQRPGPQDCLWAGPLPLQPQVPSCKQQGASSPRRALSILKAQRLHPRLPRSQDGHSRSVGTTRRSTALTRAEGGQPTAGSLEPGLRTPKQGERAFETWALGSEMAHWGASPCCLTVKPATRAPA